MSRKDYELIASAINQELRFCLPGDEVGPNVLKSLSYRLAKNLKADNPRFDRDRFLRAAGVKF